ncbi:MAG: RloB family protein [Treponema sp.]
MKAQKNKKEYESIWCIYDCDVIVKNDELEKNIAQLKAKALKNGIFIADSLPSFEIWFLLHYTIPKKYYKDQDPLIAELKSYEDFSNYEKGKSSVYSKLKDLTDKAIENSYVLADRNNKDEYDKDASFCNVYKLVEELKAIKK